MGKQQRQQQQTNADENNWLCLSEPPRIGNYCYPFASTVRLVIKYLVCSQLVLATVEAARMCCQVGSWSVGKRGVRF